MNYRGVALSKALSITLYANRRRWRNWATGIVRLKPDVVLEVPSMNETEAD